MTNGRHEIEPKRHPPSLSHPNWSNLYRVMKTTSNFMWPILNTFSRQLHGTKCNHSKRTKPKYPNNPFRLKIDPMKISLLLNLEYSKSHVHVCVRINEVVKLQNIFQGVVDDGRAENMVAKQRIKKGVLDVLIGV